MNEQIAILLADSADFVKAAATKLEKLSQHDTELQSVAKGVAEKLASSKLINASEVARVTSDIQTGGISKLADTVNFVIEQYNSRPTSMGKVASADSNPSKPLTSNQIWDNGFGINS